MKFKHRLILSPGLANDILTALEITNHHTLMERLITAGMEDPEYDYYREASKKLELDENVFDYDDDPLVSGGDEGAYVAVWHWIPAQNLDESQVSG